MQATRRYSWWWTEPWEYHCKTEEDTSPSLKRTWTCRKSLRIPGQQIIWSYVIVIFKPKKGEEEALQSDGLKRTELWIGLCYKNENYLLTMRWTGPLWHWPLCARKSDSDLSRKNQINQHQIQKPLMKFFRGETGSHTFYEGLKKVQ